MNDKSLADGNIWMVIRHPGGSKNWYARRAYQGGSDGEDKAEDAATNTFNRIAARLKRGAVLLTCNGVIVAFTGPKWVQELMGIATTKSTGFKDARTLLSGK